VYFKSQREYCWEACAQTKGLIKTVRATGILLELSLLCCDECEVFVRAHTQESGIHLSSAIRHTDMVSRLGCGDDSDISDQRARICLYKSHSVWDTGIVLLYDQLRHG